MIYNVYEYLPLPTQMSIFVRKAKNIFQPETYWAEILSYIIVTSRISVVHVNIVSNCNLKMTDKRIRGVVVKLIAL